MPILSDLIIYPIKSCAGIAVPRATLTRAGLSAGGVRDRQWMLIGEDGRFLTQREHPRMALIVPQLTPDSLALRAPGMLLLEIALASPDPLLARSRDVTVWDDTVLAHEEDDGSAAWFSKVLGLPCQLVRFHPEAQRLASAKWTGDMAAPTLFADGYPLLLIGRASLDDLNDKLTAAGRAALPMNRFRPNLVIDGLAAFEEDYTASFALDGVVLRPVKPCPRCPVPSVDQASGVVGPDPLDILQGYRRKAQVDDAACFGMNCIVVAGDGLTLSVGQEVAANLAFDD